MTQKFIDFANQANENIGFKFKLEDAKQLHELLEAYGKLIVQECATLAYDGPSGILDHFGVEEKNV